MYVTAINRSFILSLVEINLFICIEKEIFPDELKNMLYRQYLKPVTVNLPNISRSIPPSRWYPNSLKSSWSINHSLHIVQGRPSSVTALICFYLKILEAFEGKLLYYATFLDMSKAFDTISHDLLLLKLEQHGIRRKCYKPIKSYHEEREQCFGCNTVCIIFVNIFASHNLVTGLLKLSMNIIKAVGFSPFLFIPGFCFKSTSGF